MTEKRLDKEKGYLVKKFLVGVLLCLILPASSVWADPASSIFEKTQHERQPRLQEAIQNGAKIIPTPGGQSFYVLWLPEGSDMNHLPPMVVSLHGHDGYAVDDFAVWHSFLQKRGYGLMAIQWWLGTGDSPKDYLAPREIYRIIDQVFRHMGVQPGTALLHGFSRGSANIYAVAVMDRSTGNDYFSLFIANAGMASRNYPPTAEIENKQFGDQPFKGSHWVTFAGGKDPNPDRDGVFGMRQTADWIRSLGGTVDLAVEDPNADHGGFHRNPKNADAALDVFKKLIGQ